jgi:Restriction endonuclease
MPASSDKWKHFERLVTAIHQAADRGAKVQWNEKINGRQFDVTIRFRKGMYEYLTVVECKHYGKPVPVEKVDAFVTKSQDVKAHSAVMASTSAFQEGAHEVARRHNVTLIHVTESSEVDLSMFGAQWGPEKQALHFQLIELHYCDGRSKRLPEAANVMTYYAKKRPQRKRVHSETSDSLLTDYYSRVCTILTAAATRTPASPSSKPRSYDGGWRPHEREVGDSLTEAKTAGTTKHRAFSVHLNAAGRTSEWRDPEVGQSSR